MNAFSRVISSSFYDKVARGVSNAASSVVLLLFSSDERLQLSEGKVIKLMNFSE